MRLHLLNLGDLGHGKDHFGVAAIIAYTIEYIGVSPVRQMSTIEILLINKLIWHQRFRAEQYIVVRFGLSHKQIFALSL